MVPLIVVNFISEVTAHYPPNTPGRSTLICSLLNDFMSHNMNYATLNVDIQIALPVWSPDSMYTIQDVEKLLSIPLLEDMSTKMRYAVNNCCNTRAKDDRKYIKNVNPYNIMISINNYRFSFQPVI
jgi:hypothetical protein